MAVNDNAPGQMVVAGAADGVAAAGEAAKVLGAKRVVPLPVGGAFHSMLMAPAQVRLDRSLLSRRACEVGYEQKFPCLPGPLIDAPRLTCGIRGQAPAVPRTDQSAAWMSRFP